MTLAPGIRLGPYEIVAPLGAGGMGEVYRARDTRLGREVAIKVLPADVASDAERLRRFEQEAKAVSALNHPHIVTLFEVGSSEHGPYLVLEKIEGQSLRELLRAGALPVKRVLTLGAQIAEGLAKAHAAGIVHRDLKPENVMVSDDGFAKILDFGLAKLVFPELESGHAAEMTTLVDKTASGMILGTLGYLSPEQAAGRAADFRSDQFALGALLYELATGERPFRKETTPETLAAVIREEPEPLRAKNAALPAQLGWIVARCLAKDPNDRYGSTRDLARDLADLRDRLSELSRSPIDSASGARRRPSVRAIAALGVAVAIGAALGVTLGRRISPRPALQPLRVSILAPDGADFDFAEGAPAIAPQGDRFAFLARGADGTRRIWLRSLANLTAQPLAGTEGATHPFWSPDGAAVGYFQDRQLRTHDLARGESRALCEVEPTARGGAWGPDGTILFTPSGREPIFRVPATGGQPVQVTAFDEARREFTHRFPVFLPDGRGFLFYAGSGAQFSDRQAPSVFAADLDGGKPKALLAADSSALYAPSGHLLFLRGDTLLAQRFDSDRRELAGEPTRIAERVQSSIRSEPAATVGDGGMLLFQADLGLRNQFAWLDRRGRLLDTVGPPARTGSLELSHDGSRLAYAQVDERTGTRDIWVRDLVRGSAIRLSFDPGHEYGAIWSPDDRRVLYSRDLGDRAEVVAKAADGAGEEEVVLSSPAGVVYVPQSFTPDGKTLALTVVTEIATGSQELSVALVRLPGGSPTPLGRSQYRELNAQFAPDGRWLAYESNESGRNEVYVESLAEERRRIQVSTGGGSHPRWRRDGRELFFLSPDQKLVAVPMQVGSTLAAGEPRVLFEPKVPELIAFAYDVAPDGERFLFARTVRGQGEPPLTLVTQWTSALPRP